MAATGGRKASVVLTEQEVPKGLDLRLTVKVTVLWFFTTYSTGGKGGT